MPRYQRAASVRYYATESQGPSSPATEAHTHHQARDAGPDGAIASRKAPAKRRILTSSDIANDETCDSLVIEDDELDGLGGAEPRPSKKRRILIEGSQSQTEATDPSGSQVSNLGGLGSVDPDEDPLSGQLGLAGRNMESNANTPDAGRSSTTMRDEVDELEDDGGETNVNPESDALNRGSVTDEEMMEEDGTAAGGEPAEEWVEYEDEEGQTHRRLKNVVRVPFERGEDGFVSGSIRRLKFKNFLTYDDVEFFPGPHLNMIIGPNGTGKSTIACGIALGSGFSPKILGRATALRSFVKQGSDGMCFVEIEYKNRSGEPNVVIRREFTNQDDKSTFFLGDKVVSAQTIHKMIRELGIQADNLCTFLPQDKVAEFAGMSSERLLIETMKAAGDPKLPEWHASLIEDGKSFTSAQQDLRENERLLAKVDAKVAELEPEINRLRERRDLKLKIAALGLTIAYRRCLVATAESRKAKSAQARHKLKLDEMNKKLRPLELLRGKMTARQERAEKAINKSAVKARNMNEAVAKVPAELDELVDKAEDMQRELQQLKSKEREMAANIATAVQEIARLETIVNQPVPVVDTVPLELKRRSCMSKIVELKSAERDGMAAIEGRRERANELHQALTLANRQLQMYQDAGAKRRQNLANWMPSCGYAMDWIDRNRDRFERLVHFPTAVSVTVSDAGFAPSVEASLNQSQKTTFICQTQRDYNTLNELNDGPQHRVRDKRGNSVPVRIGVYYISETELNDETVHSPISHEELLRLQLEGWALDFCQADSVVKAFLKNHCRLDEAAVGRNLDLHPDVENCGLRRYYVWDPDSRDGSGRPNPHGYSTTIQNSRYGKKSAMAMTQTITGAQSFDNPVNAEDVRDCESRIGDLTRDRLALEAEVAKISAERPKRKAEMEKQEAQIRKLEAQKKEDQARLRDFEKAKLALDVTRSALKRLHSQPLAADQRAKLKKECFDNVKLRAKFVKQYADLCEVATGLVDEHIEANFELFSAKANTDIVETVAATRVARFGAVVEAHNEARRRAQEMTGIVRTVVDLYKRHAAAVEGTLEHALHQKMRKEKQSLDETERMLVTAETEFNLLPDMDRGAEQKLRESRAKQKDLRSAVAAADKKHKRLVSRLTELKKLFEPSLQGLVRSVSEKFAEAMGKVQCAGEVRVRQSDAYENWAIEIKVKFRDNEDLQILTAQRQSGGERSLSTIMYLMSLTDLARTPFSLVDEINQGMDQRAERAVHDQLVRTTNQPDGGQYFLITPKLLTNLNYHARMKVLVVNNGEWLPDPEPARPTIGSISDMLTYIEGRRDVKPEAGAARKGKGKGRA